MTSEEITAELEAIHGRYLARMEHAWAEFQREAAAIRALRTTEKLALGAVPETPALALAN